MSTRLEVCYVYIRGHISEVGNELANELPDEGRLSHLGRLKYLAERLVPLTVLWQRAKPLHVAPPVAVVGSFVYFSVVQRYLIRRERAL